jgi:Secretion system C-terminal sorting domain
MLKRFAIKLTDNWQTLKIFNLSGQQVIIVPLNGVTSKSINVGSISSGIYFIALKKKDNQLAYYKFVKL